MTEVQKQTREYIGNIIADRRKELGLEQSDVEDYTDISISTLSRLENGRANITIDSLSTLFDVLGLEMVVRIRRTV